ncbi:MAG: TraX family protein [Christensenellales bacterium]|jgi:hypothetical protein
MNNPEKRPFRIFDATTLKLIAIIAMFMDHLGYTLYPNMPWLRMVGRLTFPIMAFFIAQGASKTRDRRKYFLRLLVFAVISEAPFDLMLSGQLFSLRHQNVLFTLALGLLGCFMVENLKQGVKVLPSVMLLAALILSGELLAADYGMLGVLLVVLFYVFKNQKSGILQAGFLGNGAMSVMFSSATQLWGFAAIPLLYMYNGQRGSGFKYLFYIFYPLHMLLLWLLPRIA